MRMLWRAVHALEAYVAMRIRIDSRGEPKARQALLSVEDSWIDSMKRVLEAREARRRGVEYGPD